MAIRSSTIAWKNLWIGDPGMLQAKSHDWATEHNVFGELY